MSTTTTIGVEIEGLEQAQAAAQDAATRTRLAFLQDAVGQACAKLTRDHLNSLGPNKRGWPSSGFYEGAARGVDWEPTATGVRVNADNEKVPGALRQRLHGGTIRMKDHLLSIPARPEFKGHSPTEFTNLRFVLFRTTGSMAYVVGEGGAGHVDFATGLERNVKGAGTRAAGVVAYWLRESVDQRPDPGVLPSDQEYVQAAVGAVHKAIGGGVR